MKSVSILALGVTLALGSAFSLAAAAVQQPPAAQVPELSREERSALLALNTALEAKNYPAATTALATAQAAARSGYARYLASALQLRLGIETSNLGLQSTAIDSMIASGAVPTADLPQLYRNQAALLQNQAKLDRAEAALTRYTELAPNDAEAFVALSQIKNDRKKPQEAVASIARAIALRKAAGQPVPEGWYKRGLNLAVMHKMAPQSLQFARDLVGAYPSPVNWRDALIIYRDVAKPDVATAIDAWRLTRMAKALGGERDYLAFAQALSAAGLAGESKSVLDQGVAARMIDPGKAAFKALIAESGKKAAAEKAGLNAKQSAAMAAATGAPALAAADAFLAAGDHAKAVPLYRAALEKGGVDASIANMRLGLALALADNRPEAETAFRAVTGARAELASLWLAWLAQRG
jgi:tetratricopeptide (TPR) repeat protein